MYSKADLRVRAVVNIRILKEWYHSPRLMRQCNLYTLQLIQEYLAISPSMVLSLATWRYCIRSLKQFRCVFLLDAVIELPRADGLCTSHSGIAQQLDS